MTPIHLALLLLQASVGADEALERSLDEAIGRAQGRLEQGVELWQDHSTWESAWRVSTEHYVVRSTHSRYFAADIAEGLESMLPLFRETLMMPPNRQAGGPFAIFVYPTLEDYRQAGDAHGAEHSSFYGSFYSPGQPELPVETYFLTNRWLMRMFATHGAFHQFLDSTYERNLPPALEEGLATYFALWWNFNYGIDQLEQMRRDGRVIPLAELVRGSATDFADRPHERLIQLGMLVTYLVHFHPETRTVKEDGEIWQAAFCEYLDILLTGDDAELHPVHDLLTTRIAELERDFNAYEFARR